MTPWILLIATALAIPLSFVNAPYPWELILQHIPTVVGIILLAIAIAFYHPSRRSIGCCLGFLWLHMIGARWIYSFVPYDEWAIIVCGTSVSETFGWERNHYDRFVHLASGVLGFVPFSEFFQIRWRLRPHQAGLLAIACVLAIGAAYEILEWQITMFFSPQMADSYNGQQGDVWDAQKDLALALIGAVISFVLFFRSTPKPARLSE